MATLLVLTPSILFTYSPVEDGRHGLYGLEEVSYGLNVGVSVEYPALDRRLVGIVGDGVPGAEYQIVEAGQWNEVPDEGRTAVGPLAQPYRRHLRDRADRLSRAAPDVLDSRDER